MKITVKVYDSEDHIKEERSGQVFVGQEPIVDDQGEFDCWNEVMDEFGWPDGSEHHFVVTLEDGGMHLETMVHNSDEGWFNYTDDPGFGLWDYSGTTPKRIAKIGEEVK